MLLCSTTSPLINSPGFRSGMLPLSNYILDQRLPLNCPLLAPELLLLSLFSQPMVVFLINSAATSGKVSPDLREEGTG